jgi:2-aminoadipate transaminase
MKVMTQMPAYRWAERAQNTVASAAPATAQGNLIQLGGGYGFPDELPDIVTEAIEAGNAREETLQYGPLYGLDDLRDAIVDYLRGDGITATRENILIVNGAKHGLDLACRVFLEQGDAVIVAAPSYLTAISILKAAEATFISIPQDDEGMQTEILEETLLARRESGLAMPKFLFDIPDFHNPSGITMSAARRAKLVELAETFDFIIIEDDPYRRIRFEGEPIPPIKTFDKSGRVIGLGTVSKILAPGLRIGWVNADPAIVRRMAAHKSDHGTSPFLQRIVAQLFQNGKVAHHIDSLSHILREHRDAMVEALQRHLPGAKVRKPNGGYFLWIELPDGIDADELVRRVGKEGVAIFTGKLCFAEAPPGQFLRLAYSFSTPSQIIEGVRRIGRVYAAMRESAAESSVPA